MPLNIHQIPQSLAFHHGDVIHPTVLLIADFSWINVSLPPNSRCAQNDNNTAVNTCKVSQVGLDCAVFYVSANIV